MTPPAALDVESAEFFPEKAGLIDESIRPKFRREGKSWALEYARVEGSEAPEKLEGALILKEWGGRVHALEAGIPMTGF